MDKDEQDLFLSSSNHHYKAKIKAKGATNQLLSRLLRLLLMTYESI